MKKHRKGREAAALDLKKNPDLLFQVTESYKVARTNVAFSLLKEGCKRAVVSSSLSEEGKTMTAVHLAISLAQTDARVLLIDADLRKPKVNQYFSFKNSPGLTNYLGHLSGLDGILHKTGYNNLSVVCAGITVPNPSELLAGEKMAAFLDEMSGQFDYIVIDTPPLNVVADALPLIKQSDGVILVVRSGVSTYPELTKTVKSLEMVDAKILGIILNAVEPKGKSRLAYGYRKYGSYGTYEAYRS